MRKPFIRIGNSAAIPESIRPYIGYVILTDRLTGNWFIESSCIAASASEPTNYVGSQELVDAMIRIIGNKKAMDHSISQDDARNYNDNVVFYDDENCKIFLNGNCLFDLLEREKTDRHAIELIQRIDDLVRKTENFLTPDDLLFPGFIVFPDKSFALFENGIVQPAGMVYSTVASIAEAMIPPSMIRNFAGSSHAGDLMNMVKWQRSRGKDQETDITIVADADPKGNTGKFIALLKNLAVNVNIGAPEGLPFCLKVQSYKQHLRISERNSKHTVTSLSLPKGKTWLHLPPPLLPLVPYYLPGGAAGSVSVNVDSDTAQNSLEQFMGSRGRELIHNLDLTSGIKTQLESLRQDDHITRFTVLLWVWNYVNLHLEIGSAANDASFIAEHITSLQMTVKLPVRAALIQQDKKWTVLFFMAEGITRKTFRSWDETRGKIADLAGHKPKTSEYNDELTRLINTLQYLLHGNETAEGDPEEHYYAPAPGSEISHTDTSKNVSDKANTPNKTEMSEDPNRAGTPNKRYTTQDAGKRNAEKPKTGKRNIAIPLLVAGTAIILVLFLAMFFSGGAQSSPGENGDTRAAEEQSQSEAAASAQNQEAPSQSEAAASSQSEAAISSLNQETSSQNQDTERAADTVIADKFEKIEWSLEEVLFISNWISYNNGYDFLGEETIFERNPDWIYPGNTLTLPDQSVHEIAGSATIWFIASSFLDRSFEKTLVNEEDFRELIRNLDYNQTMNF